MLFPTSLHLNIWLDERLHVKVAFCGEAFQNYVRHPNQNYYLEVTTYLKEQILIPCEKRNNQISKEVALRVRSWNDLVVV